MHYARKLMLLLKPLSQWLTGTSFLYENYEMWPKDDKFELTSLNKVKAPATVNIEHFGQSSRLYRA